MREQGTAKQRRALAAMGLAALILVGLPPLGLWLAGYDLDPYLEFPPVTRYVVHAPFSLPVFCALAAMLLAGAVFVAIRIARTRPTRDAPRSGRPFPWWGWAALAVNAAAWVTAWNRFAWAAPIQRHTFSFLWFSYIVIVNACTQARGGQCMMVRRPRLFLVLFPVSVAFWWFFEFLNRFVQNWHYTSVRGLDAGEYFLMATLPFSTVLPAVTGTYELLSTCPRAAAGMDHLPTVPLQRSRGFRVGVVLAAAAGLAGVGVWPDYLFPVLWVSPLVILLGVAGLLGCDPVFPGLARGDWRRAWLAALSALVCGVFWEMWNLHSFAKWEYSIPFVDTLHVFEMPLLGYAGYIPFGLECVALARLTADMLNRAWPEAAP